MQHQQALLQEGKHQLVPLARRLTEDEASAGPDTEEHDATSEQISADAAS